MKFVTSERNISIESLLGRDYFMRVELYILYLYEMR
jgi:hypothetical protein